MDAQPDRTLSHELSEAAEAVQTIAGGLGFALCGVAPAERSAFADFFGRWLAEGKHGEMDYLTNHAALRADPRELLPGAQAVIAVADAYEAGAGGRGHGAEEPGPLSGKIAKYAWGDDYHKTIKKRLHQMADTLSEAYPGHTFRATVDTAPIFERECATAAGLGWTGKHTLMIHPRFGSYFLLGTLVTTLALQTSEQLGYPGPLAPPTDHCGSCTRCIDACPTDAIAAGGYSVDATRCISYLTIEHRSAIDPALHPGMGPWVAGCDICQDVCPHNRRRLSSADLPLPIHPRYTPRASAPAIPLIEILHWTEDDRRAALRGSALKRIKLAMWHRNALIAAGNALQQQDDPTLRERIHQLASDPERPEMVRVTARQVLDRLA